MEKLQQIKEIKSEIKAALIEKGKIPGDKFSEYPNHIREIGISSKKVVDPNEENIVLDDLSYLLRRDYSTDENPTISELRVISNGYSRSDSSLSYNIYLFDRSMTKNKESLYYNDNQVDTNETGEGFSIYKYPVKYGLLHQKSINSYNEYKYTLRLNENYLNIPFFFGTDIYKIGKKSGDILYDHFCFSNTGFFRDCNSLENIELTDWYKWSGGIELGNCCFYRNEPDYTNFNINCLKNISKIGIQCFYNSGIITFTTDESRNNFGVDINVLNLGEYREGYDGLNWTIEDLPEECFYNTRCVSSENNYPFLLILPQRLQYIDKNWNSGMMNDYSKNIYYLLPDDHFVEATFEINYDTNYYVVPDNYYDQYVNNSEWSSVYNAGHLISRSNFENHVNGITSNVHNLLREPKEKLSSPGKVWAFKENGRIKGTRVLYREEEELEKYIEVDEPKVEYDGWVKGDFDFATPMYTQEETIELLKTEQIEYISYD